MVEYEFKVTRDLYEERNSTVRCVKRNVKTKWFCKYVEDIVAVEELFREDGYIFKSKCLVKHSECGEKVVSMPYHKVIKIVRDADKVNTNKIGYGRNI